MNMKAQYIKQTLVIRFIKGAFASLGLVASLGSGLAIAKEVDFTGRDLGGVYKVNLGPGGDAIKVMPPMKYELVKAAEKTGVDAKNPFVPYPGLKLPHFEGKVEKRDFYFVRTSEENGSAGYIPVFGIEVLKVLNPEKNNSISYKVLTYDSPRYRTDKRNEMGSEFFDLVEENGLFVMKDQHTGEVHRKLEFGNFDWE